ncbi:MAG: FAD-binding oxidoreductase [Candidatus Dasytiphilus stammeri]
MTTWVSAKLTHIKHWTEKLFSINVEAPIDKFIAGQFTKIAIKDKNGNRLIQRAYSYVNAPHDNNLEFYLVLVKDGILSPYLHGLRIGDKFLIAKEACGFFILNEIAPCKILWMLATGTAIGPYLSMLQEGKNLDKFEYIVLVHAVRYVQDLCYLSVMHKLQERYNNKLFIQTITSREKRKETIFGRIPQLIENGSLEKRVNFEINSNTSHIMLCGNPNMVRDTKDFLIKNKNMLKKSFKGLKGNITTEHYW